MTRLILLLFPSAKYVANTTGLLVYFSTKTENRGKQLIQHFKNKKIQQLSSSLIHCQLISYERVTLFSMCMVQAVLVSEPSIGNNQLVSNILGLWMNRDGLKRKTNENLNCLQTIGNGLLCSVSRFYLYSTTCCSNVTGGYYSNVIQTNKHAHIWMSVYRDYSKQMVLFLDWKVKTSLTLTLEGSKNRTQVSVQFCFIYIKHEANHKQSSQGTLYCQVKILL